MIENHKNAWVKSEPEILNDLFKTVMWDRFQRSNSNSRSQDRDRIKNLMPKKRYNSKNCLPQNFKSCQREHFLFFGWSNFRKVNALCLEKTVALSRMSLSDKQSLCQKTTNAHHFWHKNSKTVYIFSKHFCNSPFEYQLLQISHFFQITCLPDLCFLFEHM
jgi:hypothetical protein